MTRKILYFIYLKIRAPKMQFLNSIKSKFVVFPLLYANIFSNNRVLSNAEHAHSAVNWLINSNKIVEGDGFPHSFHFFRGWMPPYPETTGYIIPTLILSADKFNTNPATHEIHRSWDWLKKIQSDEGYFTDLQGNPQVFDTGQILIGANFLYRNKIINTADTIRNSCDWLVKQQSCNGEFITNSYNRVPHTYYSRVAAALMEAGILIECDKYFDSGLKLLEWVIQNQNKNDWIENMSFSNDYPYSHTMIYTLEGLFAGYIFTGDTRMLNSIIAFANKLLKSISETGGIIRSQYNNEFLPVTDEICITGLCQWSALCFRLDSLGHSNFRKQGITSLDRAKRLQIKSINKLINGGLPGSQPSYGKYMRFSIPNWGVKFFIDALIAEDNAKYMPALI